MGISTAEKPEESVTVKPSISRNQSLSTNSGATSRSGSKLHGLPLTSSSTGKTLSNYSSAQTNSSVCEQVRPSTKQVTVALQKLVTPGGSHNPIDLIEDSPPLKTRARVKQNGKIEPHRFQNRHSRLYTNKPPRPALVPKPANGSTFTGHQSLDMYRMRTAKLAQPVWHPSGTQTFQQKLPFEVQYPLSAQYLASHFGPVYSASKPDNTQHIPQPPAYPQRTASPPPTEQQLRCKAVQYVREYSRSSPRKRKMAEDPDETSESESEELDHSTTRSFRKNSRRESPSSAVGSKCSAFTILPDPYFELTAVIEQASLLTSLLRVYPRSADKPGLKDDIAMLASVQNQHLADWLNFENGQSKKQANPHAASMSRVTTGSPAQRLFPRLIDQERAKEAEMKKQDDEVRGLLSADAELWQDGSGLGVADVYAETTASAPFDPDENKSEERAGAISTPSTVRCRVDGPSQSPEQTMTLAPLASEVDVAQVSSLGPKVPRLLRQLQ
ncbi:hypothetical protein EJ07DRAFT_172615 [Lizonia empirigonia]|nr:hypothetical protein EJ07DRAFT_172615 [Lizonia empirigonia]